jgi:hypothetical protein
VSPSIHSITKARKYESAKQWFFSRFRSFVLRDKSAMMVTAPATQDFSPCRCGTLDFRPARNENHLAEAIMDPKDQVNKLLESARANSESANGPC